MEIHIQDIDPSANVPSMKRVIANALHGPCFRDFQALPINFEIAIFPQASYGQLRRGALTLPTAEIGRYFLRKYGQRTKQKILIGHRALLFKPSRNNARPEIVEKITMLPYVDPQALEEREALVNELRLRTVQVASVQFGWECRDGAFSVEWERACLGTLVYNPDKREYRMSYRDEIDLRLRTVAIRSTQISCAAIGHADDNDHVAFFISLLHPPSFEADGIDPAGSGLAGNRPFMPRMSSNEKRQRLSALDDDHQHFVQYASLALRFLCSSPQASEDLAWIADMAHVKIQKTLPVIKHLALFSQERQKAYKGALGSLDFEVAFQLELLVHNHLVDLKEALDLLTHVKWMLSRKGSKYTAAFIRHLANQANEPFWEHGTTRSTESSSSPIRELWLKCRKDFEFRDDSLNEVEAQADTFMCLHVTVMPTRIGFDGPFPEQNNRITREYAAYTSNFIRVEFTDDRGLQYRMDRDIDDRAFIHERFGGILQNGLSIAGREFEFLAYSQSGLKQHAVWFMRNFVMRKYGRTISVTPDSIINSIGVFNSIEYDPKLIYCPARCGARISQAFTATEAAVPVETLEEILILPDIVDRKDRSFTDGVGTMSRDFAKHAWQALQSVSRRHASNRRVEYPPAIQVRCQGSKGMLSVDYRLQGLQLCLRQSMIKFDASHSKNFEVVAAFLRPGKFYLNRPLIMMLEGLKMAGGYDTLRKLQNNVVSQTKKATRSLKDAATLFEGYGLGTSFKLTSTLLHLHKLGISIKDHDLYGQLTDFAVHHVLRELKYRARIPVPNGWTLPGVADVHSWLGEREIFACINNYDGSEPHYLDGLIVVFRSPTIHPGDIQVVTAIGKPPPGSPFEREPLANTVVFPTRGPRPLASGLGGGDLDGDQFVCCALEELLPMQTFHPASYPPAARQMLDRPTTRADIADFVTEFLYSDSVGLIATDWLLRADASDQGIHDPACLALAALHSDAVDYPKTGMPVPLDRIPRNKSFVKPDWSCPEITVGGNTKLYYESQRWLGRLFREITLPEPRMPRINSTSRSHNVNLVRVFEFFRNNQLYSSMQPGGKIIKAVRVAVSRFIDPWRHSKKDIEGIWRIFQDFAYELRTICAAHTISAGRLAMLTEEEALVGTIVAKSSAPRRRKELIASLREQTTNLFDRTVRQIVGPPQRSEDDFREHTVHSCKRAWVAYGISIIFWHSQFFGAHSFSLLALSEIFDAVKKLEALST